MAKKSGTSNNCSDRLLLISLYILQVSFINTIICEYKLILRIKLEFHLRKIHKCAKKFQADRRTYKSQQHGQ